MLPIAYNILQPLIWRQLEVICHSNCIVVEIPSISDFPPRLESLFLPMTNYPILCFWFRLLWVTPCILLHRSDKGKWHVCIRPTVLIFCCIGNRVNFVLIRRASGISNQFRSYSILAISFTTLDYYYCRLILVF
jgi:hypothetical protein